MPCDVEPNRSTDKERLMHQFVRQFGAVTVHGQQTFGVLVLTPEERAVNALYPSLIVKVLKGRAVSSQLWTSSTLPGEELTVSCP